MPAVVMVVITLLVTASLYSVRGSVLSQQTANAPFSSPTQTPSPSSTPSPDTPTPTIYPSPTNLPRPTSTPVPTSSISGWIYPNSSFINTNTYVSADHPDSITKWYQDKINNLGFNVKTFVKTNANDKILNKLVGANAQQEISLEISKNPGESQTSIKVLLTTN